MVDNLSPACRKLVDGIQDLLRYKEDAQLAEAILPELIKMLKCKFPGELRALPLVTYSEGIDHVAIYQIIFDNAINLTHLAPSVHEELRMTILKLNGRGRQIHHMCSVSEKSMVRNDFGKIIIFS